MYIVAKIASQYLHSNERLNVTLIVWTVMFGKLDI